MSLLTSLQENYLRHIPKPVKIFFKRALLFFIAWKLLYHLVLFPIRIPDRQLTDMTAASTTFLYRHLLNESSISFQQDNREQYFPKAAIYIRGRRSIGIADPCNGLELYILYIGFIVCFPTTFKRQLAFIIGGIAGIFVANTFRCFGLAWLSYNRYSIVNFAHHYLFSTMLYAMIFYAWIVYSRKYFINE